MIEINDIYDIIETLRQRRSMSSRQLAIQANISTATLQSLITRRPSTIAKDTLNKIANVFGLEWYELLNMSPGQADEYALATRIPITMKPEDLKVVADKYLSGFTFKFYFGAPDDDPPKFAPPLRKRRVNMPSSGKSEFQNSIFFVLDKLNDDGLMEAMRRILDVAADPQYCKNEKNLHGER